MESERAEGRRPPWFDLPDSFTREGTLYPGALTGWRSWRVAQLDGVWHLTSAVARDVWEPGKRFDAVCRGRTDREASRSGAPCLEHGCGVYARTHRLPATYVTTGPRAAVGLVALWGRVIEHERGYRAQFAYPVALIDPTLESEQPLVRELAERYGATLI